METTLAMVLTTVVATTTVGTLSMALIIRAAYERMQSKRKRAPIPVEKQYRRR